MDLSRHRDSIAWVLGGLLGLACAGPIPAETTARDLQRAGVYCRSGSEALGRGDVAKAEKQFARARDLVPMFPDAHLGLGHVHMAQSRFEEAFADYTLAKECFAEIGEAILDLRLKRYAEIQRDLTELRTSLRSLYSSLTAANSPGSRVDPSLIERQIVQVEEEIRKREMIQVPSRESPSEAPGEVYFHLGNALFRLGRLDEAISAWETCAGRSPKFALVHNNLAVAFWKRGRFENARRSLARAEELGLAIPPQMKKDLENAAAAAANQPGTPAAKGTAPTQP